jgi:hypothetical protein
MQSREVSVEGFLSPNAFLPKKNYEEKTKIR